MRKVVVEKLICTILTAYCSLLYLAIPHMLWSAPTAFLRQCHCNNNDMKNDRLTMPQIQAFTHNFLACHRCMYVCMYVLCFFLHKIVCRHADLSGQSLVLQSVSLTRWLEVGFSGKIFPSGRSHNPATHIWPAMTSVVTNRLLSDWQRPLCILPWNVGYAVNDNCPCVTWQCFTWSAAVHRPSWRLVSLGWWCWCSVKCPCGTWQRLTWSAAVHWPSWRLVSLGWWC